MSYKQDKLDKISKIIERTGERVIIFNEGTEMVVVPFDDYENLENGSLEEGINDFEDYKLGQEGELPQDNYQGQNSNNVDFDKTEDLSSNSNSPNKSENSPFAGMFKSRSPYYDQGNDISPNTPIIDLDHADLGEPNKEADWSLPEFDGELAKDDLSEEELVHTKESTPYFEEIKNMDDDTVTEATSGEVEEQKVLKPKDFRNLRKKDEEEVSSSNSVIDHTINPDDIKKRPVKHVEKFKNEKAQGNKVNNFGFANPVDTVENITENKEANKNEVNTANSENFDKIPPPPNIG